MFTRYFTKALFLKEEERGEADLIFSLFTENFGKIEVLGKGIRKINAKLRPQTLPFSLCGVEFVQGKQNKILTDVFLLNSFKNINSSPIRFLLAQKSTKIFLKLLANENPDKKIWQHLNSFFKVLNQKDLSLYSLKLLFYYFLWNLFSLLGFQPELFNCLFCQRKLKPEKLFFLSFEGGVMCFECYLKEKPKEALPISPETVKIIRKILEGQWEKVSKIKIQKSHFQELKEISKDYFSKIINEKPL